jgi:peroxiredoxin
MVMHNGIFGDNIGSMFKSLESRSHNPVRVLILVVFLMSCGILATYDVYRLILPSIHKAGDRFLSAGSTLNGFHGIDTHGNKVVIEYGKDPRRTILLVFSPHCPWCTVNMPNWRAILKELNASEYRIVGISMRSNGVRDFVRSHGLEDLLVIADADSRDLSSYKLSLSPMTIVISELGKIERVWPGVLDGSRNKEAEQYLGIKLPGPAF